MTHDHKILIFSLLAIAGCIAFFTPNSSPFVYGVAAVAITAAITGIAMAFTSTNWRDVSRTSEVLQGVASIVTMCAVFVAGGIYFYQRQDRIRYTFNVETKIVDFGDSSSKKRVLLTVRVPTENRGARRLVINCASLGVYGLRPDSKSGIQRNGQFQEDLELEPMGQPIARSEQSKCLRTEEIYRGWKPGSIHPFFMWKPLTLEPGEIDDNYFETLVSCKYSILRILVKMRPNFEYYGNTEAKLIVPLSDVCGGRAEVRSSEAALIQEHQADTSASDGLQSPKERPTPSAAPASH
ncbi:MAG: hypothetical protein K2X59_02940 [Sphingomonas sp.]|nr:hypothetical protein [Sphingomonas sp.]